MAAGRADVSSTHRAWRSPPLLAGYGDALYDLVEDPGETRNLASTADHRTVEQELRAALAATIIGEAGRYRLECPSAA